MRVWLGGVPPVFSQARVPCCLFLSYDWVRVSTITSASESSEALPAASLSSDSVFSYSKKFLWRWTQFHLSTGLAQFAAPSVKSSEVGVGSLTKTVRFAEGDSVNITIPAQGEGTRGVLFADPCTHATWVSCLYGEMWQTRRTMPAMLQALVGDARNGVSYWGILGDNFYDR